MTPRRPRRPSVWPDLWFVVHEDRVCDCEDDGTPAIDSRAVAKRQARDMERATGRAHFVVRYRCLEADQRSGTP